MFIDTIVPAFGAGVGDAGFGRARRGDSGDIPRRRIYGDTGLCALGSTLQLIFNISSKAFVILPGRGREESSISKISKLIQQQ